MSSDYQGLLEAFCALDRKAQKTFITEFAKKISIDNFRFLKQNVTDLDRTQMDIIAALPVDALLNVYRYLEPTTPISHQLVCKKWRVILTAKEFYCIHTTGWLNDTCTPLICQQQKESERIIALKRLETMHRFQSGTPKWTHTFDIPYSPEPNLQIIGNTFMIGPGQDGEIRIVNTLTGEMSAQYLPITLDTTATSQLWFDDDAVFFRLMTLTEETIYALTFSTQTMVSLPDSPESILHFIVNGQQAAILHGEDVTVSDSEILFWNFHEGRTAKVKIPKLTSIMPRDFAGRGLTDHVVKIHLNAKNTTLTVILIANFEESLKHDEQCVILLFNFRVPLELNLSMNQTANMDLVHVNLALPTSNMEPRLDDAVLSIDWLDWAKDAAYGYDTKNKPEFWDRDTYLSIDTDKAEFTIDDWVAYIEVNNLDAFMWQGVTYSIPSALPRSRGPRMDYYVTEDPPVYIISPWSNPMIQRTTVAEELEIETWLEHRHPNDPFIIGNARILVYGTSSEATVMVFDPDINIPERFFLTDWEEPSSSVHASSSSNYSGRGRGRGRGSGIHDDQDRPPFGRGRGRGHYVNNW